MRPMSCFSNSLPVVQGCYRHADPGGDGLADYLKTTGPLGQRLPSPAAPTASVSPRGLGRCRAEEFPRGPLLRRRGSSAGGTMKLFSPRLGSELEESSRAGGQPFYSVLSPSRRKRDTFVGRYVRVAECPASPSPIPRATRECADPRQGGTVHRCPHRRGCPLTRRSGVTDELEQELIDLGLLGYCRPALERRSDKAWQLIQPRSTTRSSTVDWHSCRQRLAILQNSPATPATAGNHRQQFDLAGPEPLGPA